LKKSQAASEVVKETEASVRLMMEVRMACARCLARKAGSSGKLGSGAKRDFVHLAFMRVP